MTKDERDRAEARFNKAAKAADDAKTGKKDRDASTKAVLDNMARLRALRLAKEAAESYVAGDPHNEATRFGPLAFDTIERFRKGETLPAKLLVTDPANTYLSSHLVEARRRKLDLLRRATALATETN